MPRYFDLDDIIFTDGLDREHTLKPFREIPTYTTLETIKTQKGDLLDEVASRRNIYGPGTETEAYKIAENNVVKLIESKFDIDKIRTLDIPQ